MSDRSFTFVSQELQSIAMETKKNPREHIEEIRRVKFSIGGKPNPVMEDLHQAVKNLSAELYAKDVHFLMELIQVFFFSHFGSLLVGHGFLLVVVDRTDRVVCRGI